MGDTDPAELMDIRDMVVMLLDAINAAACDLADEPGPGVHAETAAKLAFAARQITRGVVLIEAASFEAFAASRSVTIREAV